MVRMQQYKLFILLIQAVCLFHFGMAGFERTAQPTSAFARAFSGVAMQTESNIWLNPASLSSLSSFHSSIFYSPSPFQLSQLTNYGLLLADDFGVVRAGAAVSSFGFSLYRETTGSLTIANKDLKDFGAGITLSFYHLSIAEYGSALAVALDAGVIYSLNEKLNIGAAMNNVSGASFGGDDDVPQTILAGISYRVIDNALVNVDLVKDIRYEPTYRASVEFLPHDIVTIRTGIQGEPSRIFGGVGITIVPFTVEYGIATHDELGLTHSIGISFTP